MAVPRYAYMSSKSPLCLAADLARQETLTVPAAPCGFPIVDSEFETRVLPLYLDPESLDIIRSDRHGRQNASIMYQFKELRSSFGWDNHIRPIELPEGIAIKGARPDEIPILPLKRRVHNCRAVTWTQHCVKRSPIRRSRRAHPLRLSDSTSHPARKCKYV